MLSDYQKGALLGQGTWGSVYEALRKRDTLKVAVKIIRNSIVDPLGGVGGKRCNILLLVIVMNHTLK